MGKTKQERRCVDCQKILRGKRSDALRCTECLRLLRKKSATESMNKKYAPIAKENALKRVYKTGANVIIESETERTLLKNIKEEYPEDESLSNFIKNILNPETDSAKDSEENSKFIDTFGMLSSKHINTFNLNLFHNRADFSSFEKEIKIKPFKELIEDITKGKRSKKK